MKEEMGKKKKKTKKKTKEESGEVCGNRRIRRSTPGDPYRGASHLGVPSNGGRSGGRGF